MWNLPIVDTTVPPVEPGAPKDPSKITLRASQRTPVWHTRTDVHNHHPPPPRSGVGCSCTTRPGQNLEQGSAVTGASPVVPGSSPGFPPSEGVPSPCPSDGGGQDPNACLARACVSRASQRPGRTRGRSALEQDPKDPTTPAEEAGRLATGATPPLRTVGERQLHHIECPSVPKVAQVPPAKVSQNPQTGLDIVIGYRVLAHPPPPGERATQEQGASPGSGRAQVCGAGVPGVGAAHHPPPPGSTNGQARRASPPAVSRSPSAPGPACADRPGRRPSSSSGPPGGGSGCRAALDACCWGGAWLALVGPRPGRWLRDLACGEVGTSLRFGVTAATCPGPAGKRPATSLSVRLRLTRLVRCRRPAPTADRALRQVLPCRVTPLTWPRTTGRPPASWGRLRRHRGPRPGSRRVTSAARPWSVSTPCSSSSSSPRTGEE